MIRYAPTSETSKCRTEHLRMQIGWRPYWISYENDFSSDSWREVSKVLNVRRKVGWFKWTTLDSEKIKTLLFIQRALVFKAKMKYADYLCA